MVLNQTPFYAESGGQVGDTGTISGADGLRIAVTDTQKKLGDLFVHLGRVEAGEAAVGMAGAGRGGPRAPHRRSARITRATHLLHEALRRRLGTHVTQKGSLNAPDRLRFDISPAAPDDRRGHGLGRGRGECADPREHRGDDAADDAGRRGRIGRDGAVRREIRRRGARRRDGRAARATRPAYSIELCGGTHVRRTGDIGCSRSSREGAVAAGVRRIEAVTGAAALEAGRGDRAPAERRRRGAARPARPSCRTRRRAAGGAPEARAPGGGAARKLATGGGAADGGDERRFASPRAIWARCRRAT